MGVPKPAFARATPNNTRLYIEIRGILDAAEKAGGKLSSGQSARVAELEAAVLAHKPELERAEHDLKLAEAALAAAETDAKQIGRRVAEGARVRRALDDEFQRKIGARTEGVSESERQRADALAEVMRRLLALRGRLVEIPKHLVDRIAKADEAVTKSAWDLEKLLRGIDSYDRDAYQRGIVVMGVVVAAIVSVLAWAMMR
jgi:DNA repair exonuclease SbcCD ATPase subunit